MMIATLFSMYRRPNVYLQCCDNGCSSGAAGSHTPGASRYAKYYSFMIFFDFMMYLMEFII